MASQGECGGGRANPKASQVEHGGRGDGSYYGGRGGGTGGRIPDDGAGRRHEY